MSIKYLLVCLSVWLYQFLHLCVRSSQIVCIKRLHHGVVIFFFLAAQPGMFPSGQAQQQQITGWFDCYRYLSHTSLV